MFSISNFWSCTPPSPTGSRGLVRKAASAGFSLIEILISTVILLVIVVMVSMVFQQQSAAYQSGTDRVRGQAALRNAIGMIVRDLSLAVSNSYGVSSQIKFTGDTIRFLAETGQAGQDASGNPKDGATSVQLISYTKTGKAVQRKIEGTLVAQDGRFKLESESGHSATIEGINDIKFSFSGNSEFPDTVTIRATHEETESNAASVIGWSAGPDCAWGTKDDIYVGGKP